MNTSPRSVTAMRAVTISREYGSGGGEVAARLAHRLNWQLVSHAVIERTASELGVTETEVTKHDEEYVEGDRPRILDRILEQFTPVGAVSVPGASGALLRPTSSTGTLAYRETMRDIILAAANTGRVVIVGRGGQVLLAKRRDVLHVRIVAPLEERIAYVSRREGLDTGAARRRVQMKDQARERYMQAQFQIRHEDVHLYDLIINTAVLSLDDAVDQIYLALENKAAKLNVSAEQLGPAAGLAPYPGKVADFRLPG